MTMERFVAETNEYRSKSVHDLISLKGKTTVVTGRSMRSSANFQADSDVIYQEGPVGLVLPS